MKQPFYIYVHGGNYIFTCQQIFENISGLWLYLTQLHQGKIIYSEDDSVGGKYLISIKLMGNIIQINGFHVLIIGKENRN